MARFCLPSLALLLFVFADSVLPQTANTSCPTISVTGPAGITQPGDKFQFVGTVEGDVPKNLSFQWVVSAGGKITEGQETLNISVDAEWPSGGISITGTLNVLGLPEGCVKSASETAGVIICGLVPLIDEFGKLPKNDIRGRLDTFFAELSDNPSNQGYIINYGTDREMATREKLITNHVNLRSFDRSRITIVRGGDALAGVNTKLYRVPPGSDNPTP